MLLLMIFISGVAIYQFLRGPYVFADDYLIASASHAREITTSILLAFGNGLADILVAVLLLPIFRKVEERLTWLYLILCIVNLVVIGLENHAAYELMSIGINYVGADGNQGQLVQSGEIAYARHEWMHYSYLLFSCFPVLLLYYLLYKGNLVPRLLAGAGIIASLLMLISMLSYFFDFQVYGGEFLLLPMGLAQLLLPLWILVTGFK
ncbi:hypothetical protein CEQ90_17545 [Lewinellaceae bacterium SD302]|nr:hypothetical protein CEQ90_17545 [Lewinellaceae bacterium SD302]